MSAVTGLVGLGGGAGGTAFAGPGAANIVAPVNAGQATDAYNSTQNALGQQQSFVNALGAQNGIGNQTNTYNQLQGVANGTGPNPATALLNQQTGQNVANQAALMAGQRGSNANVGLIARQAAQQGAATQQQAVGQAATTQANQSLNALNSMGNLATQQVAQQQTGVQNLNTLNQSEQGQLLNSIAQANSANVGMQSNINSANAGLATSQMQGQQGLLGGFGNAAAGAGAAAAAAKGGKPENLPRMALAAGGLPQAGVYADPASDPNNPFNQQNQAPAPQMQAPNPVRPAAIIPATNGVKAPTMNQPQAQQPNFGNPGANALYKGASSFGKFLSSLGSGSSDGSDDATQQSYLDANNAVGTADPNNIMKGASGFNPEQDMSASNEESNFNAARGGKVPAMVSPGERYLPPKEVAAVKAGKKNPMKAGEKIPGKPVVGGAKNSYANDIIPKTLEEGGLVLPRSVTQARNPEWAAHKFVRAHMAKGGMIPPKPKAKK